MKKKQNKLSLEKFNIARLTNNMRYIYGGGLTVDTDNTCVRCETTDTRTTNPLNNSSLNCIPEEPTDNCPSQGIGCGNP